MPVRYAGNDNRITYGRTPIKSLMQGETAVYGEDLVAQQLDKIFVFDDSSNTVSVTGLTEYGKTLQSIQIPSIYRGKAVTNIGDTAFDSATNIISVVIPDSVTDIGYRAFDGCSSLTSIAIGNGVTSIGTSAFWYCTSLTSVTIPDSVTSIGGSAFQGCRALESITLPFVGATKDGTGNTNFGYIFGTGDYSGNDDFVPTSLKEVIITGGTSIGDDAFNGCSGLTSVTIPDSVTSIGSSTFSGCDSLESITIPFVGATKDGTSNTHFGYIFGASSDSYNDDYVPTSLKEVIITGGTSIGDDAFNGCSGLTSVTIPDSVTSIGGAAFYNCTSLEAVYITDIGKWVAIDFVGYYANPLSYAGNLYLNGELVTDLVIPNGVTSIGNYAFDGCTSLTSITILDSVTSIGNYAFDGCSSLTSITIPDSVTSIGQSAFYGCTSLTSVTIGNSVTSIGGSAFSGCTSLTSVTIPDSVTSIGSYAFLDCTGLTSVTIGNGVTSIGGSAFNGCSSLEAVYITDIGKWAEIDSAGSTANPLYYAGNLYLNGELVTDLVIPNGVTSIGYYAFAYCDSLTSVTIPDSVTSIVSFAFLGCTGLMSVTIGNSVTSIGQSAFNGCSSLATVTIGNSVTSIGQSAFEDCTGLTSVTIPDSVTSIEWRAFGSCSSLTSVTFEGTVERWNAVVKDSYWNYDCPFTEVVCSDGTVSV